MMVRGRGWVGKDREIRTGGRRGRGRGGRGRGRGIERVGRVGSR